MSKLDDLINKLCPDGVEWKKIGDIADITRGVVMSKDYINEHPGEYPVYSSQTINNGEIGKIDTYNFEGEYLTWTTDGAYAGAVFYRNGKFSVTNVCGLINIKDKKHISTKYIKYILSINTQSHVTRGMGNAKLMSNVMASIEIPVPPLEIQNEIVRILDNFTELEEELEEELEARRKQYEYYRDSLLTFDNSVERKTLSEVTKYSDTRIKNSELKPYTYVSVENLLQQKKGVEFTSKIPEGNNSIQYVKNDILIGNIRPYLRKIWLADREGGTNGDVLTIRILDEYKNKIIPDYLFYILSSEDFFNYDIQYSKGAKMPRGSKDDVMNYKFAIPSIDAQKKIISILERFDCYCNDITSGLPAEIEARHKQYEYYRDKLLTFKRKSA